MTRFPGVVDLRISIFTTLAFWLRSSVVSVLNSLTTIMEAPPPLLVILFLPPLFPVLCLQHGDTMTLLLHYRVFYVILTLIYGLLGIEED